MVARATTVAIVVLPITIAAGEIYVITSPSAQNAIASTIWASEAARSAQLDALSEEAYARSKAIEELCRRRYPPQPPRDPTDRRLREESCEWHREMCRATSLNDLPAPDGTPLS